MSALRCTHCGELVTCEHRTEHVGRSRAAIWIDLPNVVQRHDHTCGAACLLAVAVYYGAGAPTEAELVQAMGFDERGSDPAHLLAGAAYCRLEVQEYRPMSDTDLRACLDAHRAVVLMLQAWGGRRSYADHWTDGHWVVAIGYDRRGVFVEDPMLECVRGFVTWTDLGERWHDVEGPSDERVERYGVAMWRPRVRSSRYARRARGLE